ncbi:MAG: hypothetical protein ABI947_29385 [Chloroflexota bacterium]
MMMLKQWTPEQIIRLVGTGKTAAAKRIKLAYWSGLGHDNYNLWGSLPDGRETYQVTVDLLKFQRSPRNLRPALHCTCRSHNHCEHGVALLLLGIEQPDLFSLREAPDFVQETYDQDARRARKQLDQKHNRVLPSADLQTRLLAERRARITHGIEDLSQWLQSMIQFGISDPRIRQYEYWDSRSERLIDVQAPGLASWLRQMGSIAVAGGNWMERLLKELGSLYLLIEAFQRFDSLPLGVQGDIRTAIGWHQKQDEIPDQEGIRDQWLVTGKELLDSDSWFRTQRTWLCGESTDQDALLLEFSTGDEPFKTQFMPGQSLDVELVYFDSGYPLRAFIRNSYGEPMSDHTTQGTTVNRALTMYAHAVASNLWLTAFPMILQNVIPTRYDGGWVIRDEEQVYLPISERFQNRWILMAISGDSPITVTGVWDGVEFMPLGAFVPYNRQTHPRHSIRFVDFSGARAV